MSPFDPCPVCGGVMRPIGAGRVECDWCHNVEKVGR